MKPIIKYTAIAAMIFVPTLASASNSYGMMDDFMDSNFAMSTNAVSSTNMMGYTWIKQYNYKGTAYRLIVTSVSDDAKSIIITALNAKTGVIVFNDTCDSGVPFNDAEIESMIDFWFRFYLG